MDGATDLRQKKNKISHNAFTFITCANEVMFLLLCFCLSACPPVCLLLDVRYVHTA